MYCRTDMANVHTIYPLRLPRTRQLATDTFLTRTLVTIVLYCIVYVHIRSNLFAYFLYSMSLYAMLTCRHAHMPNRPNARVAAWRRWSSGQAAAELGAVAPGCGDCGDCGGTTCIA